jgi:hypothetical protein
VSEALRNSRFWDRQLESGLPDCRLSGTAREQTTVTLGRMTFDRVFCAQCGCDGGLVTSEWCPHVFFLCDTCARVHGPPPECVEVSEAVVRGTATPNDGAG